MGKDRAEGSKMKNSRYGLSLKLSRLCFWDLELGLGLGVGVGLGVGLGLILPTAEPNEPARLVHG